jgi:quercetin dioxygenase-like cupin family protein
MSPNPIQPFLASKIITRTGPSAVTYDLTNKYETRITLPTGSTWTSGPHWHETHTEFLRVIKGRVKVILEGKEIIIDASDFGNDAGAPVVKVEKGAIHEWCRADRTGGEEVVVIETTDPADGEKQVFFWCVNGTVLEGVENIKGSGTEFGRYVHEWILWWKLLVVFQELDNWPVIWEGGSRLKGVLGVRTIEWLITHVVLAVAALLGGFCGVRGVRMEFLPKEIWDWWFVTQRMGPAFNAKGD